MGQEEGEPDATSEAPPEVQEVEAKPEDPSTAENAENADAEPVAEKTETAVATESEPPAAATQEDDEAQAMIAEAEAKDAKKEKKKKGKKGKKEKVEKAEPAQPADQEEADDKDAGKPGEEGAAEDDAGDAPKAKKGKKSKTKVTKSTSQIADGKDKSKTKVAKSTSQVAEGEDETAAEESPVDAKKEKKQKKKKKGGKKATKSKSDIKTEEDEDTAMPKVKKSKSKKGKKGKGKKKGKKSKTSSEVELPEDADPVEPSEKPAKGKKGKGKKLKGKRSTIHGSESAGRIAVRDSQSGMTGKASKHSMAKISQIWKKSMSSLSFGKKTVSQYSFSSFFSDSGSDHESQDLDLATKASTTKVKKKKGKGKKGKKVTTMESGDHLDKETTDEEGDTKKKKKKGKGKKGKKKKVEPEPEPVVEEVPQEVDIMAEVRRMKALADAKMAGEEVVEAPVVEEAPKKKKKKKKPKKKAEKKLTPKEKAALAAKMKVEAEEAEKRRIEEEKQRLEEERRLAIEKEKREIHEQVIRLEQLQQSKDTFDSLVAYVRKIRDRETEQKEWEVYVSCPRLPDPKKCDQMNTFLHLWEQVIEKTTIQEAPWKTIDVLELLDALEDLIDDLDENDLSNQNYRWIRQLFRDRLARSLDVATYWILRNIETTMHRIDIPTADFRYHDKNFSLSLWLRIQLPTPLPNPRRPPKPEVAVDFNEISLKVQFPIEVNVEKLALRAMYVRYDHLSDLCESFMQPDIPEELDSDLNEFMKLEYWQKMKYKFDNRVRPPPPPPIINEEGEEIVEIEPEPVFTHDDEIPAVPYRKLEPSASETVLAREEEVYGDVRAYIALDYVPDDVMNLRQYLIIGGVYAMHFLEQPPQPQVLVSIDLNLTALLLPKQLKYHDIYVEYIPPDPYKLPSDPDVVVTVEEIIEEEDRRLQESYDRMIIVNMTLPSHVIFLKPPTVCFWDELYQVWTTKDIYGTKYDEEEQKITFYLSKLGIFGMATNRYLNFPYTAWDLKPRADGTLKFRIRAPILYIKFYVKKSLVSLIKIKRNNILTTALQDIFGQYMTIPELIRIMRFSGVDVFPAFDAFCYVTNTWEKHWPMEKQIYFDMAQLAPAFQMSWSRWNRTLDRRHVALQIRDYNPEEKDKVRPFYMAQVTPQNALYVDCDESSEVFNEEGIEDMKFYSTLGYLTRGMGGIAVKNQLQEFCKVTVHTLYELLVATRVHSFS